MIKQAYFRGLVKRAGAMDFFTSYDDRWSRAGIAGLATLLGSKALGAGWGTSAALAALAGGGAYNTHNIASAVDKVKAMFGSDKKQTEPADQFESQMAESAQAQQDMAQQLRNQELKDEYKQYIAAGVPEQRIFETLDYEDLTTAQKQTFLDGLKQQAQLFAPLRAKVQQARKLKLERQAAQKKRVQRLSRSIMPQLTGIPNIQVDGLGPIYEPEQHILSGQPLAQYKRPTSNRSFQMHQLLEQHDQQQAMRRAAEALGKGQAPDEQDVQTVMPFAKYMATRPSSIAPQTQKFLDLINFGNTGKPRQIIKPLGWAQMRSAR